jgi:hypothetical protein
MDEEVEGACDIAADKVGGLQGIGAGPFAADDGDPQRRFPQHLAIVPAIAESDNRIVSEGLDIVELCLILALGADDREGTGQTGQPIPHSTMGVGGDDMDCDDLGQLYQTPGYTVRYLAIGGDGSVEIKDEVGKLQDRPAWDCNCQH